MPIQVKELAFVFHPVTDVARAQPCMRGVTAINCSSSGDATTTAALLLLLDLRIGGLTSYDGRGDEA